MDWQHAPLDHVIDEIVGIHHARIRETAALVRCSLRNANDRWGGPASPFERTRDTFETFWSDLDTHLFHEASRVFPAVRSFLDESPQVVATPAAILPMMLRMEAEHEDVLARLRQVRVACAACPVAPPAPEWAECAELVRRLADHLEAVVTMENGVLFPRAIALEHVGATPDAAL